MTWDKAFFILFKHKVIPNVRSEPHHLKDSLYVRDEDTRAA